MTTRIGHFEMTEDDVDLIEFSIRNQIERLSRLDRNDSTADALEKHKKLFELIALLRKMQVYRSSFRFGTDDAEVSVQSKLS